MKGHGSSTHNVASRWLRGDDPTAVSLQLLLAVGIRSAFQLVVPVVFLRRFGPDIYVDWIIFSSLAAYLEFADFGLSTTLGTSLITLLGHGDPEGARLLVGRVWTTCTVLSLMVGAAMTGLAFGQPFFPFPHAMLSASSARWVLVLLLLFALLTLQKAVVEACFRAGRDFVLGIVVLNSLKILEGSVLIVAAVLTTSLVTVSAIYLAVGLLGTVGFAVLARLRFPALRWRHERQAMRNLGSLAAPGSGTAAYVMSAVVAAQVSTLALGYQVSATSLVTFNSIRIIANLLRSLSFAFLASPMAQISVALAEDRRDEAQRLYARMKRQSYLATLALGTVVVGVTPSAIQPWLGPSYKVSYVFVLAFVVSVALDVGLSAPFVLLVAANKQGRSGLEQLLGTLLGLAAGIALVPAWGTIGVPIGLMLTDILLFRRFTRRAHGLLVVP